MITLILVTLVVLLLAYLAKISHDSLQTWKRKGIKHFKPLLFIGNSWSVFFKKENMMYYISRLCSKYPNEPILGLYVFSKPVLIVQDLGYIEKALIKDFHHFTDRSHFETEKEKNPLDAQLFLIRGNNRWRALRYKLTPIFTSGKMKSMYLSMQDCGKSFWGYLEKSKLTEMNLKETTNLLFIDIAGSAVFGFDPKVMENPDSEFRRMANKVFDFGLRENIVGMIMMMAPDLGARLGFSFNKPDVVRYFVGVLSEEFARRAASGEQRNDFVQLLMQLKEKGTVDVPQWDSNDDYLLDGEASKPTETIELTDSLLMSQAYAFLVAGVEMLGLVAMFAAFDLSQHQEIQDKVREEILHQINKYGGLTFDALKGMTYLENIIKESMRLHPSPLLLMRKCTKDYTFPNGYKMLKDEILFIPLTVVHMNPDLFPDPETFNPERFQGQGRVPAFLPFGDGPRMCIAMRFAILQIKFCISTILMKYKITLNPKTVLPLIIKHDANFLIPKDPLLFDLEKLQQPI